MVSLEAAVKMKGVSLWGAHDLTAPECNVK
jgi:hypothetical protein